MSPERCEEEEERGGRFSVAPYPPSCPPVSGWDVGMCSRAVGLQHGMGHCTGHCVGSCNGHCMGYCKGHCKGHRVEALHGALQRAYCMGHCMGCCRETLHGGNRVLHGVLPGVL